LKLKVISVLAITITSFIFSQTEVYAEESITFQKVCVPRGWTECAIWSLDGPTKGASRTAIGPFPKEKLTSIGIPGAENYELLARILDQTWTAQQAANINRWIGVTYGNGLFVAIAWEGREDNRVMTSPDGITWTSRNAPKASWAKITYGNGLFIAVAADPINKNIMTSPDGINWKLQTGAAPNKWFDITFGNKLFVAVSSDPEKNQVATSTNGISWKVSSTPKNSWRSVAYGDGQFVAIAFSGEPNPNAIMTSNDGINWTSRTSPEGLVISDITYGSSNFVATVFSRSSSKMGVITSPDGINWTFRDTTIANMFPNYPQSIAFGNGLFIVYTQSLSGKKIISSKDTLIWSTPVDVGFVDDITYGNGLFVTVSSQAEPGFSQVSTYGTIIDKNAKLSVQCVNGKKIQLVEPGVSCPKGFKTKK
jgi:hypothetical protein